MAKTTSTRTTSKNAAAKTVSRTGTARRKPAAKTGTKTAAKAATKTGAKAKPVAEARSPAAAPAAPKPADAPHGAAPTRETARADTAAAGGDATDAARVMGKRELVDRVVTASGIKKRAAKPVIEAMLKELGDALSRGETLNLQPFGKGIVKTRKNLENAEVVELRLRRSRLAIDAAESSAIPPLAEAAE